MSSNYNKRKPEHQWKRQQQQLFVALQPKETHAKKIIDSTSYTFTRDMEENCTMDMLIVKRCNFKKR